VDEKKEKKPPGFRDLGLASDEKQGKGHKMKGGGMFCGIWPFGWDSLRRLGREEDGG